MTVITRVYDTYDAARTAKGRVDRLNRSQVEVSILGNESLRQTYGSDVGYDAVVHPSGTLTHANDGSGMATGAGVGATVGGGAGLLAGLGMLAIPGVGPLVAAGWLAATAVGVAGGAVAGGAVGGLVDLGLSEDEAPIFSESLRRGAVAVSVRCTEGDRSAVEAALDEFGMMPFADRRATYEADGWRMGDPDTNRITPLAGLTPRDIN
jgi:hypothetical protein